MRAGPVPPISLHMRHLKAHILVPAEEARCVGQAHGAGQQDGHSAPPRGFNGGGL
jgi:hypothetical protein